MTPLRYDCHVHLVGNGQDGSGCWLRVEGLWLKALSEVMRRAVGMPLPLTHKDFDVKYVEALRELIRGSYVDKAMLLAQDEVYDEEGKKMNFGSFHVPNDYL
ncbi:MAG: hypothetical protein RL079_80, partial [Verrucomicrobiota bacterium]